MNGDISIIRIPAEEVNDLWHSVIVPQLSQSVKWPDVDPTFLLVCVQDGLKICLLAYIEDASGQQVVSGACIFEITDINDKQNAIVNIRGGTDIATVRPAIRTKIQDIGLLDKVFAYEFSNGSGWITNHSRFWQPCKVKR